MKQFEYTYSMVLAMIMKHLLLKVCYDHGHVVNLLIMGLIYKNMEVIGYNYISYKNLKN